MSQENVEVIRASFEFWRDGRTAEWIETLDADIEWDISAHPLPDFPDRGRMPDSDMMLDRDLPTVWAVRDGRAVRFRVFKTRAEALEALGLSE